jgi:thiol-disulfide isomerase/thioredoxin
VPPIPAVVGARLLRSVEMRSWISSKAKTDIKVVYADWCGPCQQIAPVYEKLSEVLSRPNKVTFTKVNVDQQTAVAQRYGVTA